MPAIELQRLEEENRRRRIPEEREGKLVDLCSNDYLGLSARADEFREEYLMRWGDAPMSASASRLLASRQRHHAAYEEYLGELYGRRALLFNSGYHANTGIIGALAALPGMAIVADKLIHASVIDGMRMAGADFKRFRHNDTEHLRATVKKLLERPEVRRVTVVVESVYSMDGDQAPLRELVGLKREIPEMSLYVDEAHAFGVHGKRGLGLAEELGLTGEVDILMATLGKAAASSGAFAIAGDDFIDWFVNSSRSLIFSTALPPATIGWSHLMTEKITDMNEEREKLRTIGRHFAGMLREVSGIEPISQGHIQPYLTGDAAKAIALSREMRDAGIDVLAIRRPTVPPGGERLRFSLNSSLPSGIIDRIREILRLHLTDNVNL